MHPAVYISLFTYPLSSNYGLFCLIPFYYLILFVTFINNSMSRCICCQNSCKNENKWIGGGTTSQHVGVRFPPCLGPTIAELNVCLNTVNFIIWTNNSNWTNIFYSIFLIVYQIIVSWFASTIGWMLWKISHCLVCPSWRHRSDSTFTNFVSDYLCCAPYCTCALHTFSCRDVSTMEGLTGRNDFKKGIPGIL